MTEFKVKEIVDGDTFKTQTNWKWNEQTGNLVRPAGYNTPEKDEAGYAEATKKLKDLILGNVVDLGDCHTIDRGRLVCEVFLDGKNLADYFPEYK